MPRCTVTVRLADLPAGAAEAASEALGPDNVKFPAGQGMEVRASGGELLLEFYAEGGIASLAGTVDEVLSHVQASVGVTGC